MRSKSLVFIIVTRLRINHSLQHYSSIQGIDFDIMATTTEPIAIDEISDHYFVNERVEVNEAPMREPLRFNFKGYSIWLEVEEMDNDLTETIHRAANELGVIKIPSPHITVIYGIDHLSHEEILKRFNELKERMVSWPTLRPRGIVTDIELKGVSGGLMDMAWTEISYSTTPEHESLVSSVHQIFDMKRNTEKWVPHLSLAYDNPENTTLNLMYTANLIAQRPSLFRERGVKGISLWSTKGKLQNWKMVSRFECK